MRFAMNDPKLEANGSTAASVRASSVADRTQEIDASQVLEVIAGDGVAIRGPAAANELVDEKQWLSSGRADAQPSWSSIAAVDVPVDVPIDESSSRRDEPVAHAHRTRLRRIVAATLGACGLLLACALMRVALDGSTSDVRARPALQKVAATLALMQRAPSAASEPAPSTGTLRFERGALARGIWLDGTRLNATAAIVPCGPHKVRVGANAHVRSVELPCGVELLVRR
jgi:hypothetical protein